MAGENGHLFSFRQGKTAQYYYTVALRCHHYIWKLQPEEVSYPENSKVWSRGKIEDLNKDFLLRLNSSKKEDMKVGFLYTINGLVDERWKKLYIGSCLDLRQRVREHCISCNIGTTSCLNRVKKFIESGGRIAVSWIQVQPDFLREGLENVIIGIEKRKEPGALPWNKCPGRRRRRR